MHGYESDSSFRGPQVYLAFGITAIIAASVLHTLAAMPQLTLYINTASISTGVIYNGLIYLYERWGWRWLSTIRDLNGTWVGSITSTHKGGTTVRCVMRVRQTWKRMAIELETTQSRSRTTMAALYEKQPGDIGLKYEYVCEPKNLSVSTMQTHRGVCTLEIISDANGTRLCGDYFTGRGRETQGQITVRRVSRQFLSFDKALEEEKE